MNKADALQIELFRRMSPAAKLGIADSLRRTNLELLEAGIRSREPGLDAEAVRLRVLALILPPRLFAKVYGPRP